MIYMLLSLIIVFYHFMISDKIKCSKDGSKTGEEEIDLLKNYNEESTVTHLKNKSLTKLPSRISEFKNLEELYLNYNNFTEITSDLSKLESLEILDIYEYKFQNFPIEVKLENINNICLMRNEITFTKHLYGDDSILDLDKTYPNRKLLSISQNKVDSILILQSKTFQTLYLRENKVISIRSNMFIGLLKLQSLKLAFNNLTEINNNIGELNSLRKYIYLVTKLIFLSLDYNKIENFRLKQPTAQKIKLLSLTNNELSKISVDIYNLTLLKELYLSFNKITEINDSISNLQNLKLLDLYGNKISKIPKSISELTNLSEFKISLNILKMIMYQSVF